MRIFKRGYDLSQPRVHVVHECDIHKGDRLLELKQDMWKFAKAKAKTLEEGKKRSLEEKLLENRG